MKFDSNDVLTAEAVHDERSLVAFLSDLDARLHALDVAYNEAKWRKYLRQADLDDINRLDAQRSKLLLDEGTYELISSWQNHVGDPGLIRRLKLWRRILLDARFEVRPEIYELRNKIDDFIVRFRPQIDGEEISRAGLGKILLKDPDRDHRRKAWLSMAPLGAVVETDVIELMRRRNNLARELGYDRYPSISLGLIGLSEQMLMDLFEELLNLSEDAYRAFLVRAQERLGIQRIEPWDMGYAIEQLIALPTAPFPRNGIIPAALELAAGIGLYQAAAGVQVEFADIPYGGICFPIDAPDDVRILANPREGHSFYFVLFHEFGHALHARCLDQPAYVLRKEPGPFNEGMARIVERFASDPAWLATRTGLSAVEIDAYQRSWAEVKMIQLRGLSSLASFEYQAYSDMDQNLLALYQGNRARFLLISFDESPSWAQDPIWTSYPTYIQNYVMAEVVASQSHAALRQAFGRLLKNSSVGAWLVKNYFAPGASLEWTDKIERATGEPLSARALAEDLRRPLAV